MTLYKQQPDGRFDVLEQTPFGDLEKKLEDWIEANPGLLFEGQPLAVIARQPRNLHGKYLDLLAVDRRGTTVVVELKRGEAPREVLAQALEYAAWVNSLSFEQLDEIAREYAARRGIDATGLHDLYRNAFGTDATDEEFAVDPAVVTFNSSQRIVIVAESFTPETEQTARYLRVRQGSDIHVIQFRVHRAGGETVIETTGVVGREQAKAAPAERGGEPQTDDDFRLRVKTDFMLAAVGVFDRWVAERGLDGLIIEHPRGARRIRYRGKELIYFYYAQRWVSLWLKDATEAEIDLCSHLTRPEFIRELPGGIWCRLCEQRDIDLLTRVLEDRIRAPLPPGA